MNSSNIEQKNLLIVGGDSSIAAKIFDWAKNSSYHIVASSRNLSNKSKTDDVLWLDLDLCIQESTQHFLDAVDGMQFDRIFIFIGSLNKSKFLDLSLVEIQNYLTPLSSNLFFVIQNLIKNLKGIANIVAMSSRAANSQSFDPYYAASKGSLESFLNSISRHLGAGQSVVNVRSGLIVNSTMYQQMHVNEREVHELNSKNTLLELNDFAREIWKLTPQATSHLSGKTIEIGPVY
jgi:NAD(P)-dependent dehydrogenase (short-subunit alcohol dehydrogenase family)